MGRPYKKELEAIQDTYNFVEQLDVSLLFPFFKNDCSVPLLIIGSGGSYAVAKIFELCYQKYGGFAKTITPYELKDETQVLGNSKVLIVTAGGNNPDTVGAYEYIRLYEPFKICVICMNKKSKIAEKINKNQDAVLYEIEIPFGRDGYLAVNSSVAMFTICKKIMNEIEHSEGAIISLNASRESFRLVHQMDIISNFIVLYGGWGAPAAYDLESKCSEAGLMSVQFVNYRNFAHGRHNWIDKNKDSTMLIALVTPDDRTIWEKTKDKLPSFLPTVVFETKYSGSQGAIDLLIKVFYFVAYLGELKKIDPGRPNVPDYGSKLYNVRYNLITNDKFIKKIKKNAKDKAIYRKLKDVPNSEEWYIYYSHMYDLFVDRLYGKIYRALLLDFDGTICETDGVVSPQIVKKINVLLKNNVIIGFATGRGDSLVKTLRNNIPEQYWNHVIMGYYNGTYISNLSEKCEIQMEKLDELKKFYDIVVDILPFGDKIINKGQQLSLRNVDTDKLNFYFEILSELKILYDFREIQILMSGHAIDIVTNSAGKQNVVDYIKSICDAPVLCIGDEGRLYENDFDLLARNMGLSSKYQNRLGKSGWNLAPLGMENVKATEYYFSKIKIVEDGFILEKFE